MYSVGTWRPAVGNGPSGAVGIGKRVDVGALASGTTGSGSCSGVVAKGVFGESVESLRSGAVDVVPLKDGCNNVLVTLIITIIMTFNDV